VSIALAWFVIVNVGRALEGCAFGFASAATFGAGSLDETFGQGGFAGDAREQEVLVSAGCTIMEVDDANAEGARRMSTCNSGDCMFWQRGVALGQGHSRPSGRWEFLTEASCPSVSE
jgi:hypothetical protein